MQDLREALCSPMPQQQSSPRVVGFLLTCAAFAVFGLLVWLVLICAEQNELHEARQRAVEEAERNQLFQAWSKLHPEQQLTRNEWDVLRNHSMLPP